MAYEIWQGMRSGSDLGGSGRCWWCPLKRPRIGVSTRDFGVWLALGSFLLINSACYAVEGDGVLQSAVAARRREYDLLLSKGFLSWTYSWLDVRRNDEAVSSRWFPKGAGSPPSKFLLQAEVSRKTGPDRFGYRLSRESNPDRSHFDKLGYNYWIDERCGYAHTPITEGYIITQSIAKKEDELRMCLPKTDYFADAIGLGAVVQARGYTIQADSPFPYRVDMALESGQYLVADQDVRIGQSACVHLVRDGVDALWLDKDKDFCVVRREWCWNKGKPIRARITNQNFSKRAGGVWVPEESTIELFGMPESAPAVLCAVISVSLKDFKLGLDDTYFCPTRVEPGSFVYDYPHSTKYVMPSDPSVSLRDFSGPNDTVASVFKPYRKPTPPLVSWSIAANVFAVAVVVAIIIGRRFYRRAKTMR